jgi:hypothetical protein
MPFSSDVQAALIGAAVAGILTLAGGVLTFYLETRRTHEENRRRDAEWRREKCNEAYSQAIYYLFKLQISSQSQGPSDKDVRQHLSEAQRYLSLLQAYHPAESIRQELARVALRLKTPVAVSGELSTRADEARRSVEESLHSTWSPSIRDERNLSATEV